MTNIGVMIDFSFQKEVKCSYGRSVFVPLVLRVEKVLGARMKKMLGGKRAELNLILVDDQKIWEINREYRAKDKPTDTISFAYLDGEKVVGERIVLGDIFISVETARRQAAEHGVSLKRELEMLFVHSFLHCLGFDHNDDREEEEMEGWARKLEN